MIERRIEGKIYGWWLPAATALVAATLVFLCIVFTDRDAAELVVFVCVVPALCVALLVFAIRKKGLVRLESLSLLALSVGTAWLLAKNFLEVRTTARWALQSRKYQVELRALPTPLDGSLKHVVWDSWGFVGAGCTVEYLVFDQNNSLSVAAQSKASGKFDGIPCEVWKVRRIESQWYTVLFYSDSDWENSAPGK